MIGALKWPATDRPEHPVDASGLLALAVDPQYREEGAANH
jgi:hypothetical protein